MLYLLVPAWVPQAFYPGRNGSRVQAESKPLAAETQGKGCAGLTLVFVVSWKVVTRTGVDALFNQTYAALV